MKRKALIIGSLLMATAVILGAFGAHGLEGKLAPEQIASYETGIEYMLYHSLAILLTGVLANQFNTHKIKIIVSLFLMGILLFTGSIIILSTKDLTGLGSNVFIGILTPLGGVCFISAWLLMAYFVFKSKLT